MKDVLGKFGRGHPDEVDDEEDAAALDEFIAALADGSLNLWTGPLNAQDGSPWLAEGETATDQQIWYTKQLLEGIDGASEAS